MKTLLFSVTKKDLEIHFFSGSGAGGQHRNKHMNSVRMRHPESGAMSTAQDQRSKEQNLRSAFNRLNNTKEFKLWLKIKIAKEMSGLRSVDDLVEEGMRSENIKIEYGPFQGRL